MLVFRGVYLPSLKKSLLARSEQCKKLRCLGFIRVYYPLLWEMTISHENREAGHSSTRMECHRVSSLICSSAYLHVFLVLNEELYGGFLKWWYPTTMAFPTKSDHFGVFSGYHHFRKPPYGCLVDSCSKWQRTSGYFCIMKSDHYRILYELKATIQCNGHEMRSCIVYDVANSEFSRILAMENPQF